LLDVQDGTAKITGCTCCIDFTIVLLICHWTKIARPSKLPVATWEPKSAGQTPPPRWQQPHPGRVNIGIAKSHRDVTQVEDRTLIRAKMLPHINRCRSVETIESQNRLLKWLSTSRHARCGRHMSFVVAMCMYLPLPGAINSFDIHPSMFERATETLCRGVGGSDK
jgi:hypothetical protein